ncbi:MAG: hypothetical protein ABSC47_03435 [Terracidiphilus sp.]|jgi:hypothetical protein
MFVEDLDNSIDQVELFRMIELQWQEFLKGDLPRIEQVFLAHQWPTA